MKYVFETLNVAEVDEVINLGKWLRWFKGTTESSAYMPEDLGARVTAAFAVHPNGIVDVELTFEHDGLRDFLTHRFENLDTKKINQDDFNKVSSAFFSYYNFLKNQGL